MEYKLLDGPVPLMLHQFRAPSLHFFLTKGWDTTKAQRKNHAAGALSGAGLRKAEVVQVSDVTYRFQKKSPSPCSCRQLCR